MDYSSAVRFFNEHDDYLIITHRNPDGDTLGSAAALCSALRRTGKTAYLYPNSQITEKFMPFITAYIGEPSFDPSCIVCVDVATENMFPAGFHGHVDFTFDHHPTNSEYAAFNLIKRKYSSCGEIIYEFILKLCGEITKEEADLLYIAVSTDTGCFLFANTDSHTLSIASKLLKAEADNAHLNELFFRKVSPERLKLEGLIYSGFHYYLQGKICVSTISLAMLSASGATENDLDDVAAMPNRASGCSVGITIREMEKGRCKISVRTDETVSSIAICSYFGGGGHAMAAGCTINTDPGKAEKMLVSVAEEVMR